MLKVVRSWQSGSLGAIVRSAGRSRRGAIAGGRRLNSSSPSDIMALEVKLNGLINVYFLHNLRTPACLCPHP